MSELPSKPDRIMIVQIEDNLTGVIRCVALNEGNGDTSDETILAEVEKLRAHVPRATNIIHFELPRK